MKRFFEEPKLCVEQFAVADVLTNSSWYNDIERVDPDETNFVAPISPRS